MEQTDYVKTGEDKNFEYYRNDSEVLSGDGEEEPYEEILNNREEFNVKINDKELKIKKRTLNKIMVLSDSQPEEQILFSHYKTVEHGKSLENIKTQPSAIENLRANNPNNLDSLRDAKAIPYLPISEPLSDNNTNVVIKLNTPTPSNEENNNFNNNNNDNENLMSKKIAKNDILLQIGLPPEAVKSKWFYLLLVLCGVINVLYFIFCLISNGFLLNSLLIMIFGIILIFTGLMGYNRINNKIYTDSFLRLMTMACMVLPIASFILVLFSPITRNHIVFNLIVNIITALFSFLCLFFTSKLRKAEESSKLSQMEQLL